MDPQTNSQPTSGLQPSADPQPSAASATTSSDGFEQSFEIDHRPNTSIPNIPGITQPVLTSNSSPGSVGGSVTTSEAQSQPTALASVETDDFAPPSPLIGGPVSVSIDPIADELPEDTTISSVQTGQGTPHVLSDTQQPMDSGSLTGGGSSRATPYQDPNSPDSPDLLDGALPDAASFSQELTSSPVTQPVTDQSPASSPSSVLATPDPVVNTPNPMTYSSLPSDQTTLASSPTPAVDLSVTGENTEVAYTHAEAAVSPATAGITTSEPTATMPSHQEYQSQVAPAAVPLANDVEPEDIFKTISPDPPLAPSEVVGITSQVTQTLEPTNQPIQFVQPTLYPATSAVPGLAPVGDFTTPALGAPAQPGVGQNVAMGGQSALPAKKKLGVIPKVLIGLVVLAVLVVGGLIAKAQLIDKVKMSDIDKASGYISAISDGITDMESNSVTQVIMSDDQDLIRKNHDSAKSKLAKINKQYDDLKRSKVLQYKVIQAKFEAFSKQWDTYQEFIGNSIEDVSKLQPVIVAANKKIDQKKISPNDTDPKAFADYKDSLGISLNSVKEMKLQTDSYKYIQDGYIAYLEAIISQCQAVTSAKNYSKCYKVSSKTVDTYTTVLQSAAHQATEEELKLVPTDALNDLNTSVKDLATSMK